MFGIGWAELLVIGIVALIVVGPEKLPEVARTLGKLYGQFSRTFNEAKQSLNAEIALADLEGKKASPKNQPKEPVSVKEESGSRPPEKTDG